MSDVKIEIRARMIKDSDNAHPMLASFTVMENGDVLIELREPDRTLVFAAEVWVRIAAALEI